MSGANLPKILYYDFNLISFTYKINESTHLILKRSLFLKKIIMSHFYLYLFKTIYACLFDFLFSKNLRVLFYPSKYMISIKKYFSLEDI
jgi:hypothetical protein